MTDEDRFTSHEAMAKHFSWGGADLTQLKPRITYAIAKIPTVVPDVIKLTEVTFSFCGGSDGRVFVGF